MKNPVRSLNAFCGKRHRSLGGGRLHHQSAHYAKVFYLQPYFQERPGYHSGLRFALLGAVNHGSSIAESSPLIIVFLCYWFGMALDKSRNKESLRAFKCAFLTPNTCLCNDF